MAKKSKTFRGQKKNIHPCGCFFCIGHEKEEINNLKKEYLTINYTCNETK